MIMGPVAHALIKQEFGDLPERVLTKPNYLSGYFFHVPGIGNEKLDNYTLLTWRRNLDYWMTQKAQASGVEVWQGTRVIGLKEKGKGFSLIMEKDGREQELETIFVIGANGGTSAIRKFLFPELEVRYGQVYREQYQGDINLDKSYIHWFYPVEHCPASFTLHQKDGLIVLDVGSRPGQTKPMMAWAKKYLSENHGLAVREEPVWRGGCLQPTIYRELVSHTFKPGCGNALLVGDAAGLALPISGERIGTGMKSALLAAHSIKKATKSGKPAEVTYLSEIESIISLFGEIYP
jgi:flavin-dependent dehydrogenase